MVVFQFRYKQSKWTHERNLCLALVRTSMRLEPIVIRMETHQRAFVAIPSFQELPISCKLTETLGHFPGVYAQ